MYEVIWQDGNKIEILVSGKLTGDEFKEVIHQLESLCAAHPKINVLIDTAGLESYDFKVVREDYDFFKKYKDHLKRVALVSDNKFHSFISGIFNEFTDAEIKTFSEDDIEPARKWIFPSRLPG